MLKNFFILIAIILIVNIVINAYKLYRTNKICNLYIEWLATENSSIKIFQYSSELKDLVSVVESRMLPYVQPLGMGHVSRGYADIFEQFPSRRQDFASAIIIMMEESIGFYKYKIRQCITPFYWIELIVWFPKKLLTYLGLNTELKSIGVISILSQLIYWIVFTLNFFGYDLTPLLQHILAK